MVGGIRNFIEPWNIYSCIQLLNNFYRLLITNKVISKADNIYIYMQRDTDLSYNMYK